MKLFAETPEDTKKSYPVKPVAEVDRIARWHDNQVHHLEKRLCSDRTSRDYGGFIQQDTRHADSRNSIYDGMMMMASYLSRLSPRRGDERLWDELKMHLDFIRRRQRKDGTIGMGVTGVGDASEIGFTLPGACAAFAAAIASELPGAKTISEVLANYIVRGSAAIRAGFPYTSNHRWTACIGPLAAAHRYFSNPDNPGLIDEYLADGIDMDCDGVYREERSSVYDGVADWGLLYLADYWSCEHHKKLVRLNLHHMLRMIQPCGESETLFSFRQDRGEAGRMSGDYYLFRRMASEWDDGNLAWAAEQCLSRMERGIGPHAHFVPLLFMIEDGRLPLDAVGSVAPSWTFEFRGRAQALWRRRDNNIAATAAADPGGHYFDITQGDWGGKVRSDAVLNYHHGRAVIDVVKIRWGSGTGGFRPETIDYLDDGSWRMCYEDPGWDHLSHFRPRARWGPRRVKADQRAQLVVRWENGALHCNLKVDGWEEMPFNLQFLLREGRLTDSRGRDHVLHAGGVAWSDGGDLLLVAPNNEDAVRISGLPASSHRMVCPERRIISGLAEKRCHRLICGTYTPADITFVIKPCLISGGEAEPISRLCGAVECGDRPKS